MKIIKAEETEKKTEEKMMDRNGIRKTENRKQKKRGLKKGSKSKRIYSLVREEKKGFYNGCGQVGGQKGEQSEERKRTVKTKTEREQQREEQEKSEPAGLQTSSMCLFVLLFVCSFK